MKNHHLLIALAIIVVGIIFLTIPIPQRNTVIAPDHSINGIRGAKQTMQIGTTTLYIDVADTHEERVRGLSGKTSLDDDSGLLFVLEKPENIGIWMKDMLIPIDIIWIGSDKKVVTIKKNATPQSFPSVFKPTSPALYVVEVNAGFADAHNIKIGDSVTIFE